MAAVSGIVLAGGASRRMGRDKRALAVDGRPMLTAAVDLLAAVAAEVVVSCRREDPPDPSLYAGREVRLVFDRREGGPLAGLEAGLAVAGYARAIVIPVDMPGLTIGTLSLLLRASTRPRCQAAVFAADGGPAPFPGVYRRSILPLLSAQLDAGSLRVRDLLDRLALVVVEPEPGALADAFLNVNRPADLPRAGKKG